MYHHRLYSTLRHIIQNCTVKLIRVTVDLSEHVPFGVPCIFRSHTSTSCDSYCWEMEGRSISLSRSEAPSNVKGDAPNCCGTTPGLTVDCVATSHNGSHTRCHVIDHVQCICCYGQNLPYIRTRNISRQDSSRRTTSSGAYDKIPEQTYE